MEGMGTDSKLLITKRNRQVISLHIVNDRLEHVTVSDNSSYGLGDIFVGKVLQISKPIEAAFVSMPDGDRGFLSLRDNGSVFISKRAEFAAPVIGDEILVQVENLPSKGKKAKVTGKFSINGKYAVCCKGKNNVAASSKLSNEVKEQCITIVKSVLQSMQDKDIGIIVRTNAESLAEDNHFELLKDEIMQLSNKYHSLLEKASHRDAGITVYKAPSAYLSEIRNLRSKQLKRIVTDDESLYLDIKDFLEAEQAEDLSKLTLMKDTNVSMSVLYGIEQKLDSALNSKVWLKSGGFIVIEQTEAMTVIDVNTGKYDKKSQCERTFFNINSEAADEIAYQLRLRNISGIIIVDFINMKLSENYDILLDNMRKNLSLDSVHTEIIDVTKLGLVEITRKKADKTLKEQIFG